MLTLLACPITHHKTDSILQNTPSPKPNPTYTKPIYFYLGYPAANAQAKSDTKLHQLWEQSCNTLYSHLKFMQGCNIASG